MRCTSVPDTRETHDCDRHPRGRAKPRARVPPRTDRRRLARQPRRVQRREHDTEALPGRRAEACRRRRVGHPRRPTDRRLRDGPRARPKPREKQRILDQGRPHGLRALEGLPSLRHRQRDQMRTQGQSHFRQSGERRPDAGEPPWHLRVEDGARESCEVRRRRRGDHAPKSDLSASERALRNCHRRRRPGRTPPEGTVRSGGPPRIGDAAAATVETERVPHGGLP